MIRYDKIAFTGYGVTELAKSRKFYEEILTLKPLRLKQSAPDASVEYTIGSSRLGIIERENLKPCYDRVSVAFEVENFDETIAELQGKGVNFEMGPLETPLYHMAVLRDPDGSKICIQHRKEGIA